MELELATMQLTGRPLSRRSLSDTSTVLFQSLFGKQGLPELPLFLPVYGQRQPLELTRERTVEEPMGRPRARAEFGRSASWPAPRPARGWAAATSLTSPAR